MKPYGRLKIVMVDVDQLISRLRREDSTAPPKYVMDDDVPPPVKVDMKIGELRALCSLVRDSFLSQPTLLEIRAPVVICGDVHGQYYDLLRIFHCAGEPDETNYLFLGDYVDRGAYSLEVIALLFCYRLKYPDNFFLLRGNHETASINRVYGFYDECKRRYNVKLWKTFCDVFNCLPVAATVGGRIFCCHGGLSPEMESLDQIRNIMRPTDVPDTGLLADILWSDPSKTTKQWGESERGISCTFGKDVVHEFLKKFNFDLVCRAHQVMEDGYEFFADRGLITIFSAPNYCGDFDNAGAILVVDKTMCCSLKILKPKK